MARSGSSYAFLFCFMVVWVNSFVVDIFCYVKIGERSVESKAIRK